MNWDFTRIPDDEQVKAEIKKAIQESDLKTLAKIERRYRLSKVYYCCPSEGHLKWFQYGEQKGYFD